MKRAKKELRQNYLNKPVFPVSRNEVSSHLDAETLAKLDALRKMK